MVILPLLRTLGDSKLGYFIITCKSTCSVPKYLTERSLCFRNAGHLRRCLYVTNEEAEVLGTFSGETLALTLGPPDGKQVPPLPNELMCRLPSSPKTKNYSIIFANKSLQRNENEIIDSSAF